MPLDSGAPRGVSPTCSRRQVLAQALGVSTLVVLPLSTAGCSSGLQDGGTQTVPIRDIPVGGGVIAGWYVATQPVKGTFKAFHAACPHSDRKLGHIEGGVIVCDEHGARFAVGDGAVLKGPAREPLVPAPFTRDGDVLTITMPAADE